MHKNDRHRRSNCASDFPSPVNSNQFSERAEKFLYDGFTYCGARPFAIYMKNSTDQIESLNCLYNGKLYGENCASTSQMLFNLLAYALNERTIDDRVTITLIQHIPQAIVNKEGKIYGQADRSLKKNFFDVLTPTAQFPDFQQMAALGLTERAFENFTASIDDIVAKMDSASFLRKCQSNMANVNRWLHPVVKDGNSDTSMNESTHDQTGEHKGDTCESRKCTESEIQPNIKEELPAQQNAETVDGCETDTAEYGSVDKTEESASPGKLQQIIDGLLKKNEILEIENMRLENELSENRKKLNSLEEVVKKQQFNLDGKERSIAELLDEVRKLRNNTAILEQQHKKNEEDTARRAEMLEMLRRDRTKQSDETVKRLGTKLQTYYTDYKDALDLEMSTELGENMRDQMGEIFKILSSAGVMLK